MTVAEQLAAFAGDARFAQLTEATVQALKIRILDALGCALGALEHPLPRALRQHTLELGGQGGPSSLIGGGQSAPDRAAFYNSALVRYLDFNDSYLAPGETCHPSDNLGAVLTASEFVDGDGQDLLAALAVAYQIQCRLCDVAPVRARGFDHTTQLAYSLGAAVAKALQLNNAQIAHALAICGSANNALRVTRTGALSHWKGLAAPHTAFACVHAAFLAGHGVTGPLEVFEGNKGFMDSIAGPFEIEWADEKLDRVEQTILKRYNAEIHSQSVLEAVLELRAEAGLRGDEVVRAELEVFDVAYHIIGGGEEGDKVSVATKEEADHSLPYLVAVALLDGEVMPAQYREERIRRGDVQTLLRRVRVRPSEDFSRRFPLEMCGRVKLTLADGRTLVREKTDYEGFHTRPMRWELATRKFERLSATALDAEQRAQLIDMVTNLENVPVAALTKLLKETQHVAVSAT